jgi:hypothetical protein
MDDRTPGQEEPRDTSAEGPDEQAEPTIELGREEHTQELPAPPPPTATPAAAPPPVPQPPTEAASPPPAAAPAGGQPAPEAPAQSGAWGQSEAPGQSGAPTQPGAPGYGGPTAYPPSAPMPAPPGQPYGESYGSQPQALPYGQQGAAGSPYPGPSGYGYGQWPYGSPQGGQPADSTYPGYPYAQPGRQGITNVSAIVLLVISGLLTLTLCIPGLPSLVMSIIALTKQETDPEGSRRLTRWGWVVLAIMVVLGAIAITAIVAWAITHSDELDPYTTY